MATICINTLNEVFDELKSSIHTLYAKHSILDSVGLLDLESILRNCDKMELFLNDDFRGLWMMEQEDRRRLAKLLESIPVETQQPQEVSVIERHDSFTSMPGLEGCGTSMPGLEEVPHSGLYNPCSSLEDAHEVIFQNTITPLRYISASPIQAPTPIPTLQPSISASSLPINTSRYFGLLNPLRPTLPACIWSSTSLIGTVIN